MSTKRCYYETLEVERNADESKLKSAFRKLAMKWHPDRNPGDATSEMKFKEINEAYEVLKDGEKRAAYDRYGHAAFEQGMGGGGPGFGAGFASSFSRFARRCASFAVASSSVVAERFVRFAATRGGSSSTSRWTSRGVLSKRRPSNDG